MHVLARPGAGHTSEGDDVSEESTDPAAIEAEIEATRTRLAGTVDELSVRLHPKEIARRGSNDVKARLKAATTTPDGQLRIERLVAVGAAAAALLVLTIWRRRRG